MPAQKGQRVATFRCEVKGVSRAQGRSATAAAAYRSGTKIADERTDRTHDYSRRSGVVSSELVLPEGARPMDRAELWNAAESAEKRKDAKVAREALIALPHELNDAERHQLTHGFARWLSDRHGVAVDASIHTPSRKGDERNHHAHLLMTTRRVGPDGLGEKTRDLDVSQTAKIHVEAWRKEWADRVNGALERGERARGLEAGAWGRVDHRSLEAQGIERQPEPKLGPIVTAMERRGEQTRVGDRVREVREHNAEVVQLAQERERREQAAKAQEPPQTALGDAARAEQDAKAARELELYRQALEQQAERQRQTQAERHGRERQALVRYQTERAAIEQQRDARAAQESTALRAKLAEKSVAPGSLVGRLLDRAMPGRVQEREEAGRRWKQESTAERERQERREREREERNRRELEELLRRQEQERQQQTREQAERAAASVQEFRRQQERIREQRSQARTREPRAKGQERDDYGRERERPGRGGYSR